MNNFELLESKITQLPMGEVFVVSDFTDVVDYENARKILMRLEDKGKIRRILPGIYDCPRFSEILQEYVTPDFNKVAEAISRKNNWTISPSGNTALNFFGLDTQVPAKWEYISSGPSNEYRVNNITISFTHRADKELLGMSHTTASVIQALKAIGKDQVTDSILSKISSQLTTADKNKLIAEAKQTTTWIYEDIKKIARDTD